MKKLIAISFAFVLAGCAAVGSIVDPSPAQKVFAAKQTYQAALTVAVAYKELPACTVVPKPFLCSDKAVVTAIQKADLVAFEALNSAEKVVRDEKVSGTMLDTAVTWAKEAISAFSKVTALLKVK